MAVYYIGTYDIDDVEKFKGYSPIVMSLLSKYGGDILASDTRAYVVVIPQELIAPTGNAR